LEFEHRQDVANRLMEIDPLAVQLSFANKLRDSPQNVAAAAGLLADLRKPPPELAFVQLAGPIDKPQAGLGEIVDGVQGLTELMGQLRRHVAHGVEAIEMSQFGLALAEFLVRFAKRLFGAALVGDVDIDAHGRAGGVARADRSDDVAIRPQLAPQLERMLAPHDLSSRGTLPIGKPLLHVVARSR